MKSLINRFFHDQDGATMVEYVLIVALIGVVVIAAMEYLGQTASGTLYGVSDNVANSN